MKKVLLLALALMPSRDGAFGLLIGAAVGTLFLVPAHGLAQWAPFEVDPCSSDVLNMSALEGLIRCAESGWTPDQYTLGVMYDNGNGVPEDDAEAVRWYRMAAEHGHASAQHNLGVMYAHGNGVPEDDAEAVRWYRLSAEQRYVFAQFNLGVMYSRGEGVPEDDAEAVHWYQLAAEHGDALAQTNLGFMYASGDGVPKDLVFAHMWFGLSAAQGNKNAQSNNEKIEQVMTRAQIAEGQRLTREWLEAHPPGGN